MLDARDEPVLSSRASTRSFSEPLCAALAGLRGMRTPSASSASCGAPTRSPAWSAATSSTDAGPSTTSAASRCSPPPPCDSRARAYRSRATSYWSSRPTRRAATTGSIWLAENHWDKLDAAYSINEGGIISTEGGKGKQAADLRRLARAHGTRKIRTISRRVIRRSQFGPLLSALMRTTFTNTIVDGGIRSNVIPGAAEATVNMRLLPGVTGEQAVRELRRTIRDRRVKIIVGSDDQTPAEAYQGIRERQRIAASSTDTDLYRSLAREVKAQYPGTVVTRALYEAGTDAEPWRQHGIPVYGLRPYPASAAVLEEMHGIDERVPIPGLNQGTDMVERILRAVATGG